MDISDFLDVTLGNQRRKSLLQRMLGQAGMTGSVGALPVHSGVLQHILGPQFGGAPRMALPIQIPAAVQAALGSSVGFAPRRLPVVNPVGGALQASPPAPDPLSTALSALHPYAGLPLKPTGSTIKSMSNTFTAA